jgi:hypothetical protein
VQIKARGFIPVALEVSTIMAAKNEFGELFRQVADEGHYGQGASTRTRQGTYLIAPSGRLLASGNEQNAKATLRLMEKALTAWGKLSVRDRFPTNPPKVDVRANATSKFPENGLALDVSLRKLFPRPLKDSPVDAKVIANSDLPDRLQRFARLKPETYWEVEWNQDHAWFTKEEARKLLPAILAEGQSAVADPALVKRLARLHLLDTVRALADVYPDDCVKKAELNAVVLRVEGDVVEVRFTGTVQLSQTGMPPFARTADLTSPVPKKPNRGYDAKLLGQAKYDLKKERFVAFELVALGEKSGGSKLSPFDKTRMGVTFTLSKPSTHEPIEPRYLSQYGWR